MNKSIEISDLWELNPIWSVLTESEREWLSERVNVIQLAKNTIIHSEGDKAEHMWTLATGKVRIYKEGVGQRAQIIRLLKAQDLFGFRAVIAGDTYTSYASAFEPCKIFQVEATDFMYLLRKNNRFCFEVMTALARDLAVSEIQTVNLTQKHIRGRLAEALLTIRRNYGLDEDGVTLALRISREDLANMSNMTTSNAIRTLSQFAQEDLIAVDGRHIRILDEDALKKVSRIG